MEILFTGLGIMGVTFLLAMIFDMEEGGFLMTFILLSLISGSVAVVTSDTEDPATEDGVVVAEAVEKAPAVQPPTPAPVIETTNPELRIERRDIMTNNCEVVGTINFLCTNRVQLGDEWYTVKVNCDRDPYSGELECDLK